MIDSVEIASKQREVLSTLIRKGWEIIDNGRHRIVMKRGDYVLKIPLEEGCESYNRQEHEAYWGNEDPRYAPCYFVRIRGVGCLIMERLKETITPSVFAHHLPREIIPDWAEHVDSYQIGRDRNGNFRCFDYPNDPLSP